MSRILTVQGLCKTYKMNKYSNEVLTNVNFEMEDGEFVSIMGPSGSGKSTLLYTVSGMDQMTSGSVVFGEKELGSMNKKELSSLRLLEMGFIFQQMYMMKKLCILDNIVLPGYRAGKDRNAVNARAAELMERLSISDIADHEINEVSGGQLQRACLCRALISDVMKELRKANADGTGIMMVTHSVRVAAQSERVIYLADGSIKGEIVLGKLENEEALPARDKLLNNWLLEKGW